MPLIITPINISKPKPLGQCAYGTCEVKEMGCPCDTEYGAIPTNTSTILSSTGTYTFTVDTSLSITNPFTSFTNEIKDNLMTRVSPPILNVVSITKPIIGNILGNRYIITIQPTQDIDYKTIQDYILGVIKDVMGVSSANITDFNVGQAPSQFAPITQPLTDITKTIETFGLIALGIVVIVILVPRILPIRKETETTIK
jgi:hypothetical protein